MIFVLKKVWVIFVIAVVLIPGFVEGFNLSGSKVLPEFVNSFPVFREFLVKKVHEFKEVFVAIYDPLFAWLKDGDEFFASTDKIVFGVNSLLVSDVPILESDSPSSSNEEGRRTDDGRYDWCLHYAIYLLLSIGVLILINFILDD
jgi:hypothetical protein